MKRLFLFSIASYFLFITPTFSSAMISERIQGVAYRVVKGQVLSIDTINNTFRIKDRDDGREHLVNAQEDVVNSLQQGDHVRVTLRPLFPITGLNNTALRVQKG